MARTSSLSKNTGKYPQIGENIRKVMWEVVGKKHSLEFYNLVFPGKNITDNAKRNKINLLLNGHIELKDLIAISQATGKSLSTLVYGRKKGGQQQAPGEELTIREYARLLLHLIEITGSKVEKNEGGGVKIVFDSRAPMGGSLPLNESFMIHDEKDRPQMYNFTAWQLESFFSLIAHLQTMKTSVLANLDKIGRSAATGIISDFSHMERDYTTNFLNKSILDETPEAAYLSEKVYHRYDDDKNNYDF